MVDFEDIFNRLQDLVKKYASNLINDEAFLNEKSEIEQEIKYNELDYYSWVLENKVDENSFMGREYKKKVQDLMFI